MALDTTGKILTGNFLGRLEVFSLSIFLSHFAVPVLYAFLLAVTSVFEYTIFL